MKKSLLLIEDTPSLQMIYESVLNSGGHKVKTVATAADGLEQFRTDKPDVVLLDLMLPDRDGLDLMHECLDFKPDTKFIVITANGSINRAVEAMRGGAYEFLVKPFNEQRFLHAVDTAIADTAPPKTTPNNITVEPVGSFIGSSSAMQKVYAKIRSVSRSMATVFITGESGTGKEICAQALHDYSNRASGPFVPLNCGAIPSDLLESEVFGHLKGSFTGAISDKPGAAAVADGGTLFLDEICELDMNLQAKLLRFLQTSSIQPVGASHPQKVNVRIICASNRDPMEEVRQGRFREDLYYRLYVVPIHLPPLRDRDNDVVEVAETELRNYAEIEGKQFLGLSPEVKSLFRELPWPGNIRQMKNVLRTVVVMNDSPQVSLDMLPDGLQAEHGFSSCNAANAAQPENTAASPSIDGLIGKSLAQIERQVIEATIAHFDGSIPKASRVLDVSPSTIYRKVEAWKNIS